MTAEEIRQIVREELERALTKKGRDVSVSLAEAARQLDVADGRTVKARLRRAGRDIVPGRGGRPSVRQADLDALIAPRL